MTPGRFDPAVVRRHLHRLLNEQLEDFEVFARHVASRL